MKIIINTSTLIGTGVTQVAVSFLYECRNIKSNNYFVFLSSTVKSQISLDEFPQNFTFYEFRKYPQSVIKGIGCRIRMKRLERKINPDCVFSVFGPSYWSPRSPHLMGYAYPHYVYEDSPFFNKITIIEKITIKLMKLLHRFYLKKNGKYYVCETEDVSKRLVKYIKCDTANVFTVPNTFNKYFNNPDINIKILPKKERNEFRFLSLCSFVPHKNLKILNEVVPILKDRYPSLNFKFVLTADEKVLKRELNGNILDSIINIGRIDVSVCPKLYIECDALFLPTLLECFTANYPESMKMKIPIATSNLGFATDVCKDAAIYFDPINPVDIANKLQSIMDNRNLREDLSVKGIERLKYFGTAQERAKKYLLICEKISYGQEN